MKVFFKISIFILLFLSINSKSLAIIADVSVDIVSIIGVEQSNALSFGAISSGSIGGIVSQTTTTTTTSPDIEIVSPGQQGRFTVSGGSNNDYSILIDNITQLSGASTPMNVSLAINNGIFGVLSSNGTLNGGIDVFTINGKLVIPPNQPIGSYSGTYKVTVSY